MCIYICTYTYIHTDRQAYTHPPVLYIYQLTKIPVSAPDCSPGAACCSGPSHARSGRAWVDKTLTCPTQYNIPHQCLEQSFGALYIAVYEVGSIEMLKHLMQVSATSLLQDHKSTVVLRWIYYFYAFNKYSVNCSCNRWPSLNLRPGGASSWVSQKDFCASAVFRA